MLKAIPKSDISIRPFKVYKEWDKDTSNASLLEAELTDYTSTDVSTPSFGYLNNVSYNKNSLYGQLRAQFYNGHEDNPFLRFGNKKPVYNINPTSKERFLDKKAKIISIPETYIGAGIKKKSVQILDNDWQIVDSSPATYPAEYLDDGYSNLVSQLDKIIVTLMDAETYDLEFTDVFGDKYYSAIWDFFDIETSILSITYNNLEYLIEVINFDIEKGILIAKSIPFLDRESKGIRIGNVFYSQGLIVTTRDIAQRLLGDWELSYKSTETIYENEYLLIVNPDEFNVSTNPSAVISVGEEIEVSTDSKGKTRNVTSNVGVKYIRKKSVLDNGNTLDFRYTSSVTQSVFAGFEHYDLSGSVDTTGSFLTPFITTIGLYDDNCDLVAVAKVPQPIKSEPDIPVNFIVRFDT